MLTAVLIVAAALVLGGRDLWAKVAPMVAAIPRPELPWRQLAAAGLLIGAVASFNLGSPVTPAPGPAPVPVGPIDLRGLFTGPTGAEDAAVVSALTGELADEIEWDGGQDAPRWKTGVAVDELRQAARELRCRGVSIGARQPAARDAIRVYLEEQVGTAGGPVTPEQRAKWVAALRDIGREATDAAR
jgi:hypothetical protein